jgi:predicted nucleic acid-binding protein
LAEERVLVVPPHFGTELISALRRGIFLGRGTAQDQAHGLELCLTTILRVVQPRWPERGTWERAWAWAERLRRANIYDSLYLAVAEETGADYWTADGNLVRALEVDGHPLPPWVHLLEP